jgi:hypothetical protein
MPGVRFQQRSAKRWTGHQIFHDLIAETYPGLPDQGCQIFLDIFYQNDGKLAQHYKMAIKYTK